MTHLTRKPTNEFLRLRKLLGTLVLLAFTLLITLSGCFSTNDTGLPEQTPEDDATRQAETAEDGSSEFGEEAEELGTADQALAPGCGYKRANRTRLTPATKNAVCRPACLDVGKKFQGGTSFTAGFSYCMCCKVSKPRPTPRAGCRGRCLPEIPSFGSINWAAGMRHTIERHFPEGSLNEGKSQFFWSEDWGTEEGWLREVYRLAGGGRSYTSGGKLVVEFDFLDDVGAGFNRAGSFIITRTARYVFAPAARGLYRLVTAYPLVEDAVLIP